MFNSSRLRPRLLKSSRRVGIVFIPVVIGAACLLNSGCGGNHDASTAATTQPESTAETNAAVAPNAPSIATVDTAVEAGGMSHDDLLPDDLPIEHPGESRTSSTSHAAMQSAPTAVRPQSTAVSPELVNAPLRKFVDRYDNGKPRIACTVKDLGGGRVMYHGSYLEFWSDGARFKQGKYDYSKKVGEWTWWNRNGDVMKTGTYAGDQPHGEFRVFRGDGSLERVENYEHGVSHGEWFGYRVDGAKVWRRTFQRGRPEGRWTEYHANGTKKLEFFFRKGKQHGTFQRWNEDQQLTVEGEFVDGQRHGTFRNYDASGRLIDEVEWEHGQQKVTGG